MEGLFAYRTVQFVRAEGAIDNPGTDTPGGTPDDGIAANAGKATLANGIVSPFVGVATDAGVEGLGIGVGFYVPFGGQASWDQNDAFAGNTKYPGAVDGVQRWAAIEGEQRSLYYTLAAGWRTKSGKFAIGAGVNLVQNQVSLVRARNANGTDDLVAGNVLVEGRSLLEVSGLNFAASLGVMFRPTPCSRIGISYQSQPNFGEMTLTGTLTNKFGTGAANPIDADLKQHLPDIIRVAGEYHAFRNASLHGQVDYQRWSVYENQCIMAGGSTEACAINADGSAPGGGILVNLPRNYKDTFSVRGGGRWSVSDKLELNGGLTYDSNAVPDATMDPSLFDMDKVIGQAGLVYALGKVDLSLGLAHVYYNPRLTQPRAVDPQAPSRNPDMAGSYKSQVTYALVGVDVSL